jgi:hypothetical protein
MTAQDSHFFSFLLGEAGEVPRRGGGVMGRTDAVAHDPSVADYRATSPRLRAGRNKTGSLGNFQMRLSWS